MKTSRPANHQRQQRRITSTASTITTSVVSLGLLTATHSQLPAQSTPAPAAQQRGSSIVETPAWKKYFAQGYTYIDAKVLAAFWGSSPDEAKIRLGNKMLLFGPAEAKPHLKEARAQAMKKLEEGNPPCWYTDAGYTFHDAELLAKFWGRDIHDTKAKMTGWLISGGTARADLKEALKDAKAGKKAE